MTDLVKKRNRRVFSCSNCRSKKRRCDRNFPCGECTKQGLFDTCRFEDVKPYSGTSVSPASSIGSGAGENLGLSAESPEFKREIKQVPVKGTGYTKDWGFNFFEALNKSKDGKIEASLLGYSTMPGADPFTGIVKKLLEEQLHKVWDNLIAKDGLVPKHKLDLLEQKTISALGPSYIGRLTAHSTEEEFDAARQAINHGQLQHGLYFSPFGSWTKLTLQEQVLAMLPPHSVLVSLVQVFFNFQRKWFPILNEEAFFEDLSSVIGPSMNGQCVIKRFESRADAAIAASLLIALRIAFSIAVRSPGECEESDRMSILKNPIPIDAVDVAKELLKEMTSSSDSGLPCLRAFMLLLTAQIFCPENECSREDNNVKETMYRIVSIAVSRNLNIDYSKLAQWRRGLKAFRAQQLEARALWHTIVRLDILCSILYEEPPCISPSSYMVNLPADEEDSPDSYKILSATQLIYDELQSLINYVTPHARINRFSELARSTEEFERVVVEHLGVFEDYIIPLKGEEDAPLKCQKFILLICCKSWLGAIYAAMSLFFERENEKELSFIYNKKRLTIAAKDLSFLEPGLLEHLDSYFGSGAYVLLIPFIMGAIGAQLAVSGFGLRCTLTARSMEKSGMDLEGIRTQHLYQTIGQGIMANVDISLELLEPLSEGNQHAWASTRSTRFGKLIFVDNNNISRSDVPMDSIAVGCTVEQLRAINEILNDAALERKSYKIMYGMSGERKEAASEDKDFRMMAAFQLERKWQSIKLIQTHNHKSTFLAHAGIQNRDKPIPSEIDVTNKPLFFDEIQGLDPQFIMDYLLNTDF